MTRDPDLVRTANPSVCALDVRDLNAGYLGTPVVRDLNLHVRPGEIVALLGPNGAGKTTTLATVAGLLRPLKGTVRLHDAVLAGRRPDQVAKAGLALVPEGRSLFFGLTVREHLKLAHTKTGASEDQLLGMLPELRPCLDRKAGLMSGGEQQMLALARALMRLPTVLLVDEMSLGLAPVVVDRLVPILRRAADELATAVLLVEQHVAVALAVADRAYVMNHGRVVLEGPTAQLRGNRDLLMASYLGQSSNPTTAINGSFDERTLG
jgi:branched-chain amino acid transport system ATP-binding protein